MTGEKLKERFYDTQDVSVRLSIPNCMISQSMLFKHMGLESVPTSDLSSAQHCSCSDGSFKHAWGHSFAYHKYIDNRIMGLKCHMWLTFKPLWEALAVGVSQELFHLPCIVTILLARALAYGKCLHLGTPNWCTCCSCSQSPYLLLLFLSDTTTNHPVLRAFPILPF